MSKMLYLQQTFTVFVCLIPNRYYRFYNERPNVKKPKVKKAEENWRKNKRAESNVWPKIIWPSITFGRKQIGRIGAKRGQMGPKGAKIVSLYSSRARFGPLFRHI